MIIDNGHSIIIYLLLFIKGVNLFAWVYLNIKENYNEKT